MSSDIRTQTRQTTAVGDSLKDSDWQITEDSGPLVQPPNPTPTPTPSPIKAVVNVMPSPIIPGNTVTLDASQSTGQGVLKYKWTQPRGTTVKLQPNAEATTVTFIAPDNTNGGVSIPHSLGFVLHLSDSTQNATQTTATVNINPAQQPPNPSPNPTPSPTPTNIPVKFIADVVNHSSKLSDQQLQQLCAAVKKQLDADVAPYWGYTADFNFGTPQPGHAKLGVFDNADQPGDLGWHSDDNNQVTIEIFYVGTLDDVGVTISHEMIETVGDYNAETTVPATDPNGKPCTYFEENCDPVESDEYKIDNVGVSNFVTPAWFQLQSVPNTPDGRFDFLKKTSKPFEIDSGGYMEISYDNGRTWSEVQERTSGFDKFSGSRKRMRDAKKQKESS
jgi:hypothetical protein